jgi:hypothetical protein
MTRPAAAPRKTLQAELHRQRLGVYGRQGLTPARLAGLTGLEVALVRKTLQNMRHAGEAVNIGTPQQPRWRSPEVEDASRSSPRLAPLDKGNHYIGAELRPFAGRPGAMDAFNLPSLVNGERVPARRPTAQCVGVLLDKRSHQGGL